MSRKVTIAGGQTIWDIAIQEGGSIEYVTELMRRNPEKIPNLDAALEPGDFLLVEAEPVDKEVKAVFDRLFETRKQKPATLVPNPGEGDEGDPPTSFGDFNDDFNNDFNT